MYASPSTAAPAATPAPVEPTVEQLAAQFQVSDLEPRLENADIWYGTDKETPRENWQ